MIFPTEKAPVREMREDVLTETCFAVQTKRFKGIGYVDLPAFRRTHRWAVYMSYSRLDGTPINNNGRTIVTSGRHKTTWHIFVAARNRYITVIMLGLAEYEHPFDTLRPR